MELERFRIIRERISEIVNIILAIDNETLELSDEEKIIIINELEQFISEIHNSDLSNIPFEEYEGFFDLGFDFNETGANIDFNIIDVSFNEEKLRYQGCIVRNLDLSKVNTRLLDDNSFDSKVIEANPEYFAPQRITDSEVRKRYYSHNLTLEDLKKYDLNEIPINRFNYQLVDIIEKIGIDNAVFLDEEMVALTDYRFFFKIRSSDLTPESSSEEIDKILRSAVIDVINNKYSGRNIREKLLQSRYVRENLSEYIINFPDDRQELKDKYFENELVLSDIINNLELFKGKKFIGALNFDLNYEISSNYTNLTEEQIIYLVEKLPNILNYLKIIVEILFMQQMKLI